MAGGLYTIRRTALPKKAQQARAYFQIPEYDGYTGFSY